MIRPYAQNPDWGVSIYAGGYDRPKSVSMVNLHGYLDGFWHKLFHCHWFSSVTTAVEDLRASAFAKSRSHLSEPTQAQFLAQFEKAFGQRKRIKETEWKAFCYQIKEAEVPYILGEAHFFTVQGRQAYSDSSKLNFTLIPTIDPNQTYLQGASWTGSVAVLPAFQKKGIATALYQIAESVFGMEVLPAACLTEEGKALHRRLGKISY